MEPDGSYSASQVDELLKCPICLDRYKHPKHLPCQHTVCKAPCLARLLANRPRILQCPQCRATHPVPAGGLDAFPDNIIINNLLDLPRTRAQTADFKCSNCATKENLSICPHCDKQFSSNCRPQHLSAISSDVRRLADELKRKLPQLSHKVKECDQKRNGLNVCFQKLKLEINQDIDEKIRLLNERREALLTEAEVLKESRLHELGEMQEKYELETASAASFCDSVDSKLQNIASATQMQDIRKQCEDMLKQLQRPVQDSVSVAASFQSDASFIEAIQRYGRIQSGRGERDNSRPGAPNRGAVRNGHPSVNFSVSPPPRSRPFLPSSVWDQDSLSHTFPSRHSPANMSSLFGPYPTNQRRTDSPPIPTLSTIPTPRNEAPRTVQEAFSGFISLENPNFRRRRRTQRVESHPQPRPRRSQPQHREPPPEPQRHLRRQGTFTRDEDDDDDIVTSNTRRSISFQISLNDPAPLPPRTPNSLETQRPVNNYQQKHVHRCIQTRRAQPWFESCTGVATAPDTDNIYIVDHRACKILIFDTNGRHIKSFGTKGNGQTDLDKPFDAIFRMETLYVTDAGNNRIQAYNADGVHQRFQISYNFQWPQGIATDDGSLYVCDTGHGRICVINDLVTTFRHDQVAKPTYIAAGRNRVVVGDPDVNAVFIFSADGQLLRQFGQEGSAVGDLLQPRGLAVDFQGFILVANSQNYRIDVFRENGRFYCTFGERGQEEGQFTNLEGISITSNGRVAICDGKRVQIF